MPYNCVQYFGKNSLRSFFFLVDTNRQEFNFLLERLFVLCNEYLMKISPAGPQGEPGVERVPGLAFTHRGAAGRAQ